MGSRFSLKLMKVGHNLKAGESPSLATVVLKLMIALCLLSIYNDHIAGIIISNLILVTIL